MKKLAMLLLWPVWLGCGQPFVGHSDVLPDPVEASSPEPGPPDVAAEAGAPIDAPIDSQRYAEASNAPDSASSETGADADPVCDPVACAAVVEPECFEPQCFEGACVGHPFVNGTPCTCETPFSADAGYSCRCEPTGCVPWG